MKFFTLYLLFVLSINSAIAQTASRLVAETNYVPLGNSFVPNDSITNRYTGNNGGDLTHTLKFTNEANWIYLGSGVYDSVTSRLYQTFDANDNIDSIISEEWNNFYWRKVEDALHAYDADNRDTSFITQVYDSISPQNVWANDEKTVYGYDLNNHLTYIGAYVYISPSWAFNGAAYYAYDSHNKVTSEKLIAPADESVGFDTTTWQYIYGYNSKAEDTLLTIIRQDSSTAPWDTISRSFYTYYTSNTNDSVEIDQSWIAGTNEWVNSGRYFFTYDNNNNNISIIGQTWDTTKWGNLYEYLYTYNGFNQRTSDKLLYWNDSGYWQINQFCSEDFYYYQDYYTGINQLAVNTNQLVMYPNPASNYIHVDVSLKESSPVQLSLVNILGQIVWSANEGNLFQFNGNISVSELPAGIYLLQMKTSSGIDMQKVVVAR